MILSDKQQGFIPWLLAQKNRELRLTGYAGTGKTTLMERLSENYPGDLIWIATTHAAKDILSEKINGANVLTVHSALGLRRMIVRGREEYLPTGKSKITPHALIVVDESSMLNRQCFDLLISSPARRILFVGDDFQIPPVNESESPVYKKDYPTYHLTEVFRQDAGPILNLATDVRTHGLDYAESIMHEYGIEVIRISEAASFYERYHEKHRDGIALCATHQIKDFLNNLARKLFNGNRDCFFNGETLLLESSISGVNGPRRGTRVQITNTPERRKFMGLIVWGMEIDGKYNVKIPVDNIQRKIVTERRKALETAYREAKSNDLRKEINAEVESLANSIVFATSGYAQTIHSAQGSTHDNVLLCTKDLRRCFRDKVLRTRMVYTAITRSKKSITLATGD